MANVNNEVIALAIRDFLIKNDLAGDLCRIYYDGKRISFVDGKPIVEEGIKASSFFKYAVDKWVNMTFEGAFYSIMNYPNTPYEYRIAREFEEMLDFLGCYSELGNAWNLNIVPINS